MNKLIHDEHALCMLLENIDTFFIHTWWSSQWSKGSNWVIWLSSMRIFSCLEQVSYASPHHQQLSFSNYRYNLSKTIQYYYLVAVGFNYLLFLNFHRIYSVLKRNTSKIQIKWTEQLWFHLVMSSPFPSQYMKGPSFWMKSSRPLEPSLRNLSTSWPDLRKSASL